MCGRFALHTTETELREKFLLKNSFVFKSKYNIAPGQLIPVIVLDKLGHPELVFMQWGFVPSWKTAQKSQNIQRVSSSKGYINARIETIAEKPTFKKAFVQKRCFIPASGFFEWQLIQQRKQPFFIYLKQEILFAMAGIWALPADDAFFPTCAILTKAHQNIGGALSIPLERMPVIIPEAKYSAWLNPRIKTPSEIVFDPEIGFFPVSSQVNSPLFDHPDCLRPLS